jgi:hypothetical protein
MKIVLNTRGANATELAVKAATIVSKMTGNANFPTPSPVLTSITTQINLVNAKLTEQQASFRTYQQKTAELQTERLNLSKLLETEASYVQIASNGDEAKIKSSGFDVRQKGSPIGVLPAPENLLLYAGYKDGEVNAAWNSVRGAKSYNVEISTDVNNADAWEFYKTVTRSRCSLSGFTSGSRIWVRVIPINGEGEGAPSDPAVKTVP